MALPETLLALPETLLALPETLLATGKAAAPEASVDVACLDGSLMSVRRGSGG
ncbi:MAG: hypothetical protein ACYCO3_13555 [Mycobacteriales bacterium]